jgi:STAS-like domain of unknown function (DUF4325)
MTTTLIEINVAREFTTTPGPRKRVEGSFSGEDFLENHLRPRFQEALQAGTVLKVELDGAVGYPTSFLEEAFGGLARQFGPETVQAQIEITCHDEPYLVDQIRRYIRDAKKTR